MRYPPLLRLLSLALAGRGAFAFLSPGPLCVAAGGDRCLHAQHGAVFAPPVVVAARAAGRPTVAAAVAVAVARKQPPALR